MVGFEMHPNCFHVTPMRRPNIERLGMLTMKGVVEVPLPQPDQTGPNGTKRPRHPPQFQLRLLDRQQRHLCAVPSGQENHRMMI